MIRIRPGPEINVILINTCVTMTGGLSHTDQRRLLRVQCASVGEEYTSEQNPGGPFFGTGTGKNLPEASFQVRTPSH